MSEHYAALAQTHSMKCRWHEKAADVVRTGDRETTVILAEDVAPMLQALEFLGITWRKLSSQPQGFEALDGRMETIRARLSTAAEKMAEFAEGKREDIPELTEKTLPYRRNPDNSFQ